MRDEPSPRSNSNTKKFAQLDTNDLGDSNRSLFRERKKTHCFGAGREHFEKVYNPVNVTPDSCVPGPGTYSDKTRNIAVEARKFSLTGRNIYMDPTSLALKRAIPPSNNYGDP